jgi:hypothetical protein
MEVGVMPKENINDQVAEGFRVEIGWGSNVPNERLGHVQIATVNQHSPFAFEGDESREAFDGWHVTLDREGINRLIRSLRRARDSAYGADA